MVLKPHGDLEGIHSLVNDHVANAKKARMFGKEISYVLPRDKVSK